MVMVLSHNSTGMHSSHLHSIPLLPLVVTDAAVSDYVNGTLSACHAVD